MSKRDFKFFLLIGLLIYGILTLFPFLWMLITSFKPIGDTFKLPPSLMPSLLFSEHPFLNFEMVFKERNFFRYFINSCIVASLAALGQLFTCSLAGFAFARINFRGKNIIYGVLIATMFVPTEVTIIPEFFMMRSFGWLDTLLPLIVPSMLVGAFGTLMMTEYFKSVPRELEEAAFIDGARSLQIFLNVFIPAARPALASLFVVAFIHWDELLGLFFTLPTIIGKHSLSTDEFCEPVRSRVDTPSHWGIDFNTSTFIVYFSPKACGAGICYSGIKIIFIQKRAVLTSVR